MKGDFQEHENQQLNRLPRDSVIVPVNAHPKSYEKGQRRDERANNSANRLSPLFQSAASIPFELRSAPYFCDISCRCTEERRKNCQRPKSYWERWEK